MNNELVKYPRTPHLPTSPGMTSDDKRISLDGMQNLNRCSDLIVTEKMDGGNLTFTRDYFFARSLDSGTHLWDTRAKALWSEVRYDIPAGWRISGESLLARRSVGYENLPGPFLVFGIWNEKNELISWDETEEWTKMLHLPLVPVIYRGPSLDEACKAWFELHDSNSSEGFVIRNAGGFTYDEFRMNVAKYVRADHVQTDAGWRGRDDFEINGFAE